MAPALSADSRARLMRLRSLAVRRLPEAADALRRVLRPVRAAVQEPHQQINLEATVAGALATSEASIIGLSQELSHVAERLDQLQRVNDELTATVRQHAEALEALRGPPPTADFDQP